MDIIFFNFETTIYIKWDFIVNHIFSVIEKPTRQQFNTNGINNRNCNSRTSQEHYNTNYVISTHGQSPIHTVKAELFNNAANMLLQFAQTENERNECSYCNSNWHQHTARVFSCIWVSDAWFGNSPTSLHFRRCFVFFIICVIRIFRSRIVSL